MTEKRIKLLSVFFVLFLTACGGTTTTGTNNLASIPAEVKQDNPGSFKVGDPYYINGKRYVPQESYTHTETGIASWYGPNFHGKPTANGEIFDMYELTAAHRTLQLPSLVRVTNLENGRSLIVRVNDRGPFKRGRIIDLSQEAAELLGFKNQGTAKVKVQVLREESKAIAVAAKRGKDTRGIEVAMNENQAIAKNRIKALLGPGERIERSAPSQTILASLAEPAPARPSGEQQLRPVSGTVQQGQAVSGHVKDGIFMPNPVVEQVEVSPTSIFVQAGSFGDRENAQRLARDLDKFGAAEVYPALVNGKQYFRVRIGPVDNVDKADIVLSQLANSGHADAMIVVE